MEQTYLRVHPSDSVLVALQSLPSGMEITVDGTTFCLQEAIPAGHKFALRGMEAGNEIVKYGSTIGIATKTIPRGSWVHTHTMKTSLSGIISYAYNPTPYAKKIPGNIRNTFLGYPRTGGKTGTRNELWIIPTVSCVNHTTEVIAEAARKQFEGLCDGIYALPHNTGCSQVGEGASISQQILKGIVQHPNAGGVLLVSLGCENNDLKHFLPLLDSINESRVRTMVTQEIQGDEIAHGLDLIGEILHEMHHDTRVETPVSKLILGLKCGGSDAFSGLTANPLVGCIADRLGACDGSGILTEVPEMFGAEHLLMNRADTKKTFDKIVAMINSFKQYYLDSDIPIYENPSPGNREGGITTLEEKSLGNIQKSGFSPITDTLTYGECVKKTGINLLEGPGNDNVSITNMLASGAQMLLFTTGRGNPLSSMIPTVKISSNSKLAEMKPNWIDFNAGTLLEGASLASVCDQLWNQILDIASGLERTKSETGNYRAIMIFKKGVLL